MNNCGSPVVTRSWPRILTLVQLNSIAAVTAVLPVPRAPQLWYQYCDEYTCHSHLKLVKILQTVCQQGFWSTSTSVPISGGDNFLSACLQMMQELIESSFENEVMASYVTGIINWFKYNTCSRKNFHQIIRIIGSLSIIKALCLIPSSNCCSDWNVILYS